MLEKDHDTCQSCSQTADKDVQDHYLLKISKISHEPFSFSVDSMKRNMAFTLFSLCHLSLTD